MLYAAVAFTWRLLSLWLQALGEDHNRGKAPPQLGMERHTELAPAPVAGAAAEGRHRSLQRSASR